MRLFVSQRSEYQNRCQNMPAAEPQQTGSNNSQLASPGSPAPQLSRQFGSPENLTFRGVYAASRISSILINRTSNFGRLQAPATILIFFFVFRASDKPYFVYVLWSPSREHFYIGISEDVPKRLSQHNDGVSRWTSLPRSADAPRSPILGMSANSPPQFSLGPRICFHVRCLDACRGVAQW
jgi:hypothetical protein